MNEEEPWNWRWTEFSVFKFVSNYHRFSEFTAPLFILADSGFAKLEHIRVGMLVARGFTWLRAAIYLVIINWCDFNWAAVKSAQMRSNGFKHEFECGVICGMKENWHQFRHHLLYNVHTEFRLFPFVKKTRNDCVRLAVDTTVCRARETPSEVKCSFDWPYSMQGFCL